MGWFVGTVGFYMLLDVIAKSVWLSKDEPPPPRSRWGLMMDVLSNSIGIAWALYLLGTHK